MPVKSKDTVGPCEVSLDIEVEAKKVAEAVDRAYREFSKYVSVPGFRKGKAPMSFVKQRVPQDQLRERAVELLVGPAYQEALSESELQAYAQPRVELVKLETTPPDFVFEFKAIVPLAPKVTLGQYKGLTVDRERVEVDDAQVEERINSLRERSAEYPLVENRSAQMGDVVVGDLSITPTDPDDAIDAGGEPGEFRPTAIQLGDAGNIPGVDEALLGANRGDEKTFDLTYPADYPNAEVAGKRAHFVLRVNELHTKNLPELDEEFAKKFGGTDTIDEMRLKIRADMERANAEAAETAAESKLIDSIVTNATIEYPSMLIDVEMEEDIRAFREDLERREVSVQDYLERSGITEEQLLSDFRGRADIRLRRGLVLGEIARQEGLQLTDEDIEREIQFRADAQRTSVQAMRAYIDRSNGMDNVRNTAYTKKVLGFVTGAATINDKIIKPEAPNTAAAASAKPAKSKSKKTAAAEVSGETVEAQANSATEEQPKPKRARKKAQGDGDEAGAAG